MSTFSLARNIGILMSLFASAGAAFAQTAPPALLTPADGASVQVPFTISWSAVLPASQQNGGYNWQVSTSPSFTTLVLMDATNAATTQDTISGLANGTYHWRVNAVNSALSPRNAAGGGGRARPAGSSAEGQFTR